MDERTINDLNSPQPTEFHSSLLAHVKSLADMSRTCMHDYYGTWDANWELYRSKRKFTDEDKKEIAKGGIQRFIVPMTFAQVEAFVTFCHSLYFQRNMFFELEGVGPEDHEGAKLGEVLLERDLIYNRFPVIMDEFLKTICIMGLGVLKLAWTRETFKMDKTVNYPAKSLNIGGQQVTIDGYSEQQTVDVVKYEGNQIYCVSPFHFLPDTRVPLTRYREGEFCGSEGEFTRTQLKRMEVSGLITGVDHIANEKRDTASTFRRYSTGFEQSYSVGSHTRGTKQHTIIVTELEVDIIPAEFVLSDGNILGPEKHPVRYLVAYANGNRIVKVEPMTYGHGNFSYHVAQFSPTQHEFLNQSLVDNVGRMQEVIDWMLNAHIRNQRDSVTGNRWIGDPDSVHVEDIAAGKKFIRLKNTMVGERRIADILQPFPQTNITQSNVQDVGLIQDFVQRATGITENVMGQYHTGRRSAREAGNIATFAGNRLRVPAKVIWEACLSPLGNDMLANLREFLTEETYVKVRGEAALNFEEYINFKIDPNTAYVPVSGSTLGGRYDFTVFDGTLPTEKQFTAEVLEATLIEMLKSPMGIQLIVSVLGYDPKKIYREILELRGVKNPERLMFDEARLAEFLQNANQLQQSAGGVDQSAPAGPQGLA